MTKTAIKILAVLLLSFHAFATIVSLIPYQSSLGEQLRPLFKNYQIATGTQQHWDMFTEIPTHRSYEIDIQAMDTQAEVHTFGAILPGFEEINTSRSFRYHSLFSRLSEPRYARYVVPYSRQIAAELNQRTPDDRQLQLYGFEVRSQRLRTLEEIRQGSELTILNVKSGGPWNLNE